MEAEMWRRYWLQKTLSSRDELIEHYTPYAKAISLSLYGHWASSELLAEDFVQYGALGLIEAVERYATNKNASFKTYARYRIRGAILNAVFTFSEFLDYQSYKKKLKKDRLDSIITNTSQNNSNAFDRFLALTLDYAVSQMIDFTELKSDEELADDKLYVIPEEYSTQRQLVQMLDNLPERNKRVLKLHYLEGLTFTEIAKILEVSKASVSQFHYLGLELLREFYRNEDPLDKKI